MSPIQASSLLVANLEGELPTWLAMKRRDFTNPLHPLKDFKFSDFLTLLHEARDEAFRVEKIVIVAAPANPNSNRSANNSKNTNSSNSHNNNGNNSNKDSKPKLTQSEQEEMHRKNEIKTLSIRAWQPQRDDRDQCAYYHFGPHDCDYCLLVNLDFRGKDWPDTKKPTGLWIWRFKNKGTSNRDTTV